MNVIQISDIDDARLDVFMHLTEAQLRNKLEPEKGIFIAESPKVIFRALDAGYTPVSFLLERRHLDALEKLFNTYHLDVPVYTGDDDMLAHLTGYTLTRGILCAMRRRPLPSVNDVLKGAHRVTILEDITNTENVGAIFRSAAALGVDAVLLTPECCDPLYRRAARVSMGTVFQVPWTRIGHDKHDWPGKGIQRLHDEGFACAAMCLSPASILLSDERLLHVSKLAMIFGTEGRGLRQKTIDACDVAVRIPMAHHVDSLNVAASSAVAFWQLCNVVQDGMGNTTQLNTQNSTHSSAHNAHLHQNVQSQTRK